MTRYDLALLRGSWRSWISSDGVRVGPYWLQLLWTFLFAAALAVLFTVIGFMVFTGGFDRGWGEPRLWAYWYGKNLIVCLTVAYTIHGLFELAIRWAGREKVRRWTSVQRSIVYGGIPIVGLVIGWPIGVWLAGVSAVDWFSNHATANMLVGSVGFSLLLTFFMHHYFAAKARQFEAEKRAAEAQLRLLQGQIEPHFMFNTLANVVSLIDVDAPQAKQMLEAFIDYLRASLRHLREGDSTLGDELALSEAYLGLMQTRMGRRLRYRIDAPDAELRRTAMPPLLLQPLVENAIQHGLECKVEGGTVTVTARRDAAHVVIEVEDDGLGAHGQPARRAGHAGNGVALQNLRARLQSRWGGDATLALELRTDAGARATLKLPMEAASTH